MSDATRFQSVFPGSTPLIGVVHLPPLPGYPGCPGINALIDHALADLAALEQADFAGILIENENDRPHRVLAEPETIAAMTRIVAAAVREAKRVVVGAEILLNDPRASLAVAKAAGARFIRTDYFVDRMAREEYGGEMRIDPRALLQYRDQIEAREVLVLADVQVKYARMIEPRPLAESVREARAARADGIIVTGTETGDAPQERHLLEAREAAGEAPVLIGSGLDARNAARILPYVTGAIVGTGIMTNGKLDAVKATELRELAERYGAKR